jgi:uncharacterized repeat protein (TIGR01451 family)
MKVVARLSALLLSTSVAAGAAAGCLTDSSQLNFQAGLSNAVDTNTSPGDVLLSKSGVLDQQNTQASNYGTPFDTTNWVGQTFTPGTSGALTRVDLSLFLICSSCAGAPNVIVSIRATSNGLPAGADLATAQVPSNTLSGGSTFAAAIFISPANVSSGTKYAILVRPAATFSGQFGLSRSGTSSGGADVYSGGALINSPNGGTSWTVQTFYFGDPSSDSLFKTYVGGGYAATGDWTSSLKDAVPQTGTTTNWQSLAFNDSTPNGTDVRFQAAASNNSAGPFNFVGPDGTAGTYFTTTGASLSRFNGNRYFKYRAYLTTSNGNATPTFADATVCYANETANAADLSITNSDGVTTAVPGDSITYSIKASNAGPTNATGVHVTDTFPAGLTCNWTCSGTGGGTCTGSHAGNIAETAVGLPSGASVTYLATCSIAATATGSLVNVASVSSTSIVDGNSANNSASDTDTLTASTNVALGMTDNTDRVRVGDVVNYVIELTNSNGPSSASVSVTDTLPAQLSNGSWVCTASGGASCGKASGSGNKLTDSATLPNGGKIDYVLTATVMSANANGEVSNSASAKVTSGGNQSATNISASDSDVVVIFMAGFEGGKTTAFHVGSSGGGSSVTLQLGVDAGLLSQVSVTPVTVATGRAADGAALFSIQLMRLDGGVAMRTLTTIDASAFSDVSPWTPVALGPHRIGLAWQSATARGDDGYLLAGSLPLSANNAQTALTTLQVTVDNDVAWLVPITP